MSEHYRTYKVTQRYKTAGSTLRVRRKEEKGEASHDCLSVSFFSVCESLAMGDDLSSLPDWGCLQLRRMLRPQVVVDQKSAVAKMLGKKKLPRMIQQQNKQRQREEIDCRQRSKSVLQKRHVEEGNTRDGIRSHMSFHCVELDKLQDVLNIGQSLNSTQQELFPRPDGIPSRSRKVRFQLEQHQPKRGVGLETLRRRLDSNLKFQQDILHSFDPVTRHLHQGPQKIRTILPWNNKLIKGLQHDEKKSMADRCQLLGLY